MKKVIYLMIFLGLITSTKSMSQTNAIFAKGELSKTDNHTGDVWLRELNHADTVIDCSIATASFAAGAKLDWHIHPAGQILMITEGTGYYQEKGKPVQVVNKGDVIKCVPGVAHWHGASPTSAFTYIAASTNSANNKTIWLKRVTDEEYNSLK